MATSLLYLYTESPLHAGTGSTASVIDLPVQRERITNYPHVYGSGLKGALRDQADASDTEKNIFYGPSETEDKTQARLFNFSSEEIEGLDKSKLSSLVRFGGALSVGEARLVLFPVRSLTGIFAYVTSPYVLARLARDLQAADVVPPPTWTQPIKTDECIVSSVAKNSDGVAASGSVVLEEFTFKAVNNGIVDELASWLINNAMPVGDEYSYWRKTMVQRLVILPDDAFRDFVSYSTQVVTRIRVNNDTKTVVDGQLWTQEVIPSDTLFVSTVLAHDVRAPKEVCQRVFGKDEVKALEVRDWMRETTRERIQIGGDETTGHGIVAVRWQASKESVS